MGSEDPRRILAAVAVLVLALGLLGFQVVQRMNRGAEPQAGVPSTDAEGMMEEDAPQVLEPAVVVVPREDILLALERNPFLRPANPRARTSGAAPRTTRPHDQLQLTGIRTGPRPMAIIDDRFRWVGDTVREWRVLAIDRDRVTLERSDGRTIDLVLQ